MYIQSYQKYTCMYVNQNSYVCKYTKFTCFNVHKIFMLICTPKVHVCIKHQLYLVFLLDISIFFA